ncbi:lipid A export permease/ATP-binding protein MsbA [Desulforhopalus sp. IMCC35007]|uniref:lipid A export permease/ATP-binding protein MsbA n=1 Tax=Desulforhopalus sp. IMCC35007 TaxID=2569543 RepID=UPI0010AE6BA8|nr:lipid A export permease/ATP-binding protein MsbA [Desulforhopalus sp. IMCC35007]TKB10319.1 lipid A export permease/ATP-binding protein MsbA [Desulforhopalus sp. IMCC35007]
MTNKEILLRLYIILKPYKTKLIIAMIAMIFVACFTGAQTYMVKTLLDRIFIEKNTVYLKLLPLVLISIFLMKGVFYYVYSMLLEYVGQSVIRDFRITIFKHIHKQALSFFNEMPTGTLMSRIISDVALLQQAVSKALVGSVRDFFQVVILLGVVFAMNWRLAMITFIVLPFSAFFIVKFGRQFRKLSTSTQEEVAHVSNILHETITGNRIVKAFTKEQYEGNRFENQVIGLFSLTMKDAKYRCLQHPMMEFIGGFAIAIVIWFGGSEVMNDTMTPGAFFAFLTALIAAYEPIKGVTSVNSTIQQGLAAASRVFAILDVEPEIQDKQDAIELPAFNSTVEFKNLSYQYSDEATVLKDINLTVTAGEALAIVGPSGGGKTTLTNLIPRFLDLKQGAILIDGMDIRDVTVASLRNQIAMVTQQTILFNDTVRNNIAYSNQDAAIEDVHSAARAAHAFDFIESLPDGFDTIIGEGGARLSGGQRQRISIARAILKNAPILILDEATSALDTESEREVQKALENLMKDRTTFVIAHRLSTIKNADRIVVVKDGRIVEEGTHESLLQLQGEYETLYNMQYK